MYPNYRNASSYIEAEATCILSTSEEIRKFIEEDKYIVPLSQLLKLAHCTCSMPSCNLPVDRHITKSGAALLIKFTCPAGHCVKWTSSPSHKDSKCSSISAINLLLANSILLSGNNIAKIDMFLDFMGVASISKSSFFLYQKQYICPACNQELLGIWTKSNFLKTSIGEWNYFIRWRTLWFTR